jgi:hypothetical protein
MRAPPRDAAAVLLAAIGVVLLLAFFATETLMRLAWIGGVALALAGLLAGAAALGFVARPMLARPALVAVAAFGALVVWQGLSVLWSVLPDASWNGVNRALVYGGFLVLGLFGAAFSERAPRVAGYMLAAVLGVLMLGALAGKVFAGIEDDYGRVARLRWPIGYWNGLALLAVVAVVLGLWLAVERRVEGAALLYAAMVVAALTLSRGAIAAGVVAVIAWLWLERRRVETLAAIVVAGVPAAVVAAVGFALDGITSDGQPRSVRAHDGWIFGLVVLAGLAAVVAAAYLLRVREVSARAQSGARRVAIVLSVLALAGLVGATVVGWNDFVDPPSGGGAPSSPERLTRASSNHRWEWWGESWQIFRDHPLDGSGAASFRLAHRLFRSGVTYDAVEPHDLPLQVLAESGIVGFVLLAVIVGGAGVAVRERFRDDDRTPVVALAVAALAWAVHALVDIPYEFLAVTAPFFFVLGVLFARPGPRVARGDVTWAVGLAGIAACAILSLAAPALAEKRLAEGRFDEARTLNPVSVEPVLALALRAEIRGRELRALQLYHEAVDLQPENPTAWEQLGLFELKTRKNYCAAYQALNQAYTLDRNDYRIFYKGGPLDVARAKVNAGACG